MPVNSFPPFLSLRGVTWISLPGLGGSGINAALSLSFSSFLENQDAVNLSRSLADIGFLSFLL